MTTSSGSRQGVWLARRATSARRALTMTLLVGAVGAGLAFLATRQGWAQVRTTPPRPLPPSLVSVTGSALVPYADALAVAGLASLAAVLATRGVWRRLSGLLLLALSAGLAASAFAVSAAGAVAAAAASVGPASNPGAGSVTSGSGGSSQVPDVVGAAPHVTMMAAGWQALVVAGAVAMMAAALVVIWRPSMLAVMSGRYDGPAGRPQRAGDDGAHEAGRGADLPREATPQPARVADSASMWEALSRGDDPTAGGREAAGA